MSFSWSREGLPAGVRPRAGHLVREQLGGRQERDPVPAQRVRHRADQAVGALHGQPRQHAHHLQVGHDAGEDPVVLDLARHHRLADAGGAQGLDGAPQLAEPHPVDLVHLGGEVGRGLLVDGHRHHPPPPASRRLRDQERETAVPRDHPQRGVRGGLHSSARWRRVARRQDHPALRALDEADDLEDLGGHRRLRLQPGDGLRRVEPALEEHAVRPADGRDLLGREAAAAEARWCSRRRSAPGCPPSSRTGARPWWPPCSRRGTRAPRRGRTGGRRRRPRWS